MVVEVEACKPFLLLCNTNHCWDTTTEHHLPPEKKGDRPFHPILKKRLASLMWKPLTCFSRWPHQVMEQFKDCWTFPFSSPFDIFLHPLGLSCRQRPITLARRLILSQRASPKLVLSTTLHDCGSSPALVQPRRHLKIAVSPPASPKPSALHLTKAHSHTKSSPVLQGDKINLEV